MTLNADMTSKNNEMGILKDLRTALVLHSMGILNCSNFPPLHSSYAYITTE